MLLGVVSTALDSKSGGVGLGRPNVDVPASAQIAVSIVPKPGPLEFKALGSTSFCPSQCGARDRG